MTTQVRDEMPAATDVVKTKDGADVPEVSPAAARDADLRAKDAYLMRQWQERRSLRRWAAGVGATLLGYLGLGELLEEGVIAQPAIAAIARQDAWHDLLVLAAVTAALAILLTAGRTVAVAALVVLGLSAVAVALWLDAAIPGTAAANMSTNVLQQGSGSFAEPEAVRVRFFAGAAKNPTGSCQLGQDDYALAVGGTWEAPTLRFFSDTTPATEGDPVPNRSNCTDPNETWVESFEPGEVAIWSLR